MRKRDFFVKGFLTLCMATAAISACDKDEPTGPPALYVGEELTFSLAPAGETKTIVLQTNVEVQLDKTSTAAWCEVSLSGKTLTVTAAPNTSLAARTTTVVVFIPGKSETLTFEQGGQPTAKMQVESASASSEQPGEPISRTYDGVVADIYHSNYGDGGMTFELTYQLKPAPTLELAMIAYYPRSNKGNGTFGTVSVEVEVNGSGGFEQVLTDFACGGVDLIPGAGPDGGSTTQEQRDEYPDVVYIELDRPVANVTSVKIIVDGSTSRAGHATCAEMEFYGTGSTTVTEPYLLLSKDRYDFTSAGGSVGVGVVTNATDFTVSGEAWCTVTRSGNFVTFTAPENNSGAYREANVTITGVNGAEPQQIKLTQARKVSDDAKPLEVDKDLSYADSWYPDDGHHSEADPDQPSGPFSLNVFDGDYKTYWHSNYDEELVNTNGPTHSPHNVYVKLASPSELSYIIYYPRNYPNGGNGNWGTIKVYVLRAGGDFSNPDAYEYVMDYDCGNKGKASQIVLPKVMNVEAVMIVITDQQNSSCSELRFFSE
ncbi:MAG: hypothetical protein LBH84_04710 [Prevotellaceae bacterium]|jgi:hypothetical protein|nr:hypothetical protein [Prevotellaceae bacterium]